MNMTPALSHPRRARFSRRVALVVALASALVGGCGREGAAPTSGGKTGVPAARRYHCPMHPSYTASAPGTCPICNMTLELIDATSGTNAAAMVEGRTSIMLSTNRQDLVGVTYTRVVTGSLSRILRVNVAVDADERRQYLVSPRVGGWARKLHANFTGQAVRKGDPLLEIYSPELLAAQQEYLQVRASGDAQLAAAARRRLALWDLGDAEIAALESRGTAPDTVALRSPADGIVTKKSIVEGEAFAAGQTLYAIADLTHVWFRGYVYEADQPLVTTGMESTIELPALPGRGFGGRIVFVAPSVDPSSRQVEVRIEAENPGLILRPGMWGTAEIERDIGSGLVVPASALIDTGRRHIAFVRTAPDTIEPREVKLGAMAEDRALVASGLKEGDEVVTRALFLIDAESQIKGVVAPAAGEAKSGGAASAMPP